MSNSNKLLLSIAGLTATGKTSLTLKLAEEVIDSKKYKGVILISADSKQVYQGLEILTGADIPPSFTRVKHQPYDYFQHKSLPIQIHGLSLINPDDEWSVAHFRDLAIQKINKAWDKNQLPIVVGGTGLYHQQLLTADESIYVKPNPIIREKAEELSLEELQNWLREIAPAKISQMNESDINNPRRLIRAIEITKAQEERVASRSQLKLDHPYQYKMIAIKADLEYLDDQIRQRVEKRIESVAIQEVEKVVKKFENWEKTLPAFTATGFRLIQSYLQEEITIKQLKHEWIKEELSYAKRQLTWFKKFKPDSWLVVNSNTSIDKLSNSLSKKFIKSC